MTLFFFAWLFIGLMFIQGFYFATRDGEIWGWWERFFDEHTIKLRHIKSVELLDKFISLEAMDGELSGKLLYDEHECCLQIFGPLSNIEERKIQLLLNVNSSRSKIGSMECLFLFENEHVYRFPWILRKMANCSVCMSGWLGTILYVVGAELISFNPHRFTVPYWFGIFGWIGYCACLVFLNKLSVSIFTKLDN